MYYNLKSALHQKGITIKQYAQFLGVGEKTVQNKMKGATDFTYPEFKKTCSLLFRSIMQTIYSRKEKERSKRNEIGVQVTTDMNYYGSKEKLLWLRERGNYIVTGVDRKTKAIFAKRRR